MIEDINIGKDAAGFPVVSWHEARALGSERIECRIAKTSTGELIFVARGHVRLGPFEEGRPWQQLRGFAIRGADELYQGVLQKAVSRHFANKSPLLGATLHDGAKVLVATFRVGAPMHLNYVAAQLGELERLHAILSEAFLHGAGPAADSGWHCAPDDARIETFNPERTGWADAPGRPLLARVGVVAANVGMAALALALLGGLAYLVLVLFGVVRI